MTWEEIKTRLGDKLWRLCNLYSIKAADTGKVEPFIPRPEQMAIFNALGRGVRKIIILKARRLGMSTAIDVYAADEIAFNSGLQVSIVDQNQDDASKKLNGIVKIAIESLPERIRKNLKELRSNDSAFEICSRGGDTASALYAGKNARGGTNQILHISEWGVIQADDTKRSEEILTGALPSAEHGVTIIETTWKGGRGGHLWDLVKEAMELPEEHRTLNDWHLFFFPWWTDPTYTEAGDLAAIDAGTMNYLVEKEAEIGRKLTDGQKSWYARRRKTLGLFIYREFPTTIDECFKSPMEGAIYADLIDVLRKKGAIRPAEVDGSALVHTFWDEGSPLNTVTWYVQIVGPEVRIIDYDADLDMTPVERVAHMLRKGYPYGNHYLTHAAQQTEKSGRTFATMLAAAGLQNIKTVPRTHDVWIGINEVRQIMPRMTFRLPACEEGLDALSNYHTRRESSGGLAVDVPVHDWSSHTADALRTLGEAMMNGMLKGGTAMRREPGSRPTVRMGINGGNQGGGQPRARGFR